MASAAGNHDGEAYQSTVFIATSLDTRLVTTVSGSDTVSDFKKKILLEHQQCFPAIGNIRIDRLKVKRKGVFYHLSDSMLVKSAFGTTKGNWFVSVDASSLEHDINIQHFYKHKAEDGLALPWVTHNSYGSLTIYSNTVPFENVSKNLEEDVLSDDKQLTISKDLNLKKQRRDVSNDSLLIGPSECGLSVKKRRKTQRVKSNVKASEENVVLTYDNDTRVNIGEKSYDLDQIVAVVPSSLEDVGRETVADVAMVAEKNIQHGICKKEEENEPVQKAVMENEIPSSLTGASDCERDAAGLTVVAPLKRCSKRSTKHKATEKEVFSTSFIKELHNINKDAIDSSQQDIGSNGQDSRDDLLIHKHKEDIELPEVKLPERRKRVKKSRKNKKETLVMHDDDNIVGDISSIILAPILDEKIIEKNGVLETTLVDDYKKNEEMIVKDVEVSELTKSCSDRVRVENMEEKSKNKLKDRSRKRKKDIVVKQSNDVATSMDALRVDWVGSDGILMNNDVERLRTEKIISEVMVEDINDDKLEKPNENTDDVKKNKRKRKTKKVALRNEDELITKHVNVEIFDNVKEGPHDHLSKDQSAEVELESKKSQSIDHHHHHHLEDISKNVTLSEVSKVDNEVGEEEEEKKKKSLLTGPQDWLSKHQSTEVELDSKKSQSFDHHHDLEDISKNVTESDVSKVNNEGNITNDGSHELNFVDHFAPGDQPNQLVSIDNRKVTKKPKKKTKDDSRIISKNEGLVGKAAKNNKSSLTGPQGYLSELQSTEVELESKKSQSIDHNHHQEDTSKNMTGSEVSKVNTEAGSYEINFMDYFAPGHQPNKVVSIDNKKDTKKPKKIILKYENNKAVTGPDNPNINQLKTPKTTKNIDAESSSSSQSFGRSFHNQKSNKQQSVVGPAKKVLPVVNKLFKTPAKIFEDYDSDKSSADDNATVNSDSVTRTPSRNPMSSSSSGESASSIDSRRNESHAIVGGKNRMMSQNKLKNMSMSDLLRSSSRFKKAKFSASQVEDTESQPVDFVPDSQPLG